MEATTIPVRKNWFSDGRDGESLPALNTSLNLLMLIQDFQSDGAAFLKNGGQRGPQLDFLKPEFITSIHFYLM